jgi:gliding motility-associated-like protein
MPTDDLASPYEETTIANPVKSTLYTVTGTDENGCVNSDTLTLEVQHNDVLYVPNVFSPNNDGENDVMYVRGTGFRSIYFTIYDRWGELVFETDDQSVGWDGTFRGKELDPAVFVYYVKAVFWDSKEIKQHGSITLVR